MKKSIDNVSTLEELIGSAVIQVTTVFQLDEEQVEKFRDSFTTIAAAEILAGYSYSSSLEDKFYGFTSGGDLPTHNMKEALIEAGISTTGMLPKGYCFLSTFLPITGELLLDAQIMKEEMAVVATKKAIKRK